MSQQQENTKNIQKGDTIPSFTLIDQQGAPFHIDSLLGKKNLVIYFYPRDHTPGCTREACSFRDAYEVFKEYGAEVIGISSDNVQRHKRFADQYRLPFILLSDPERTVRKRFGVPSDLFGLIDGRVTYIVNKKGIVIHTINARIQIRKHIEEALEVLKSQT